MWTARLQPTMSECEGQRAVPRHSAEVRQLQAGDDLWSHSAFAIVFACFCSTALVMIQAQLSTSQKQSRCRGHHPKLRRGQGSRCSASLAAR